MTPHLGPYIIHRFSELTGLLKATPLWSNMSIVSEDISRILENWDYQAGQLKVRAIEGHDTRKKIQIRMDLGLMQLEWSGRPDGAQPHDRTSLLDYFVEKRRDHEKTNVNGTPFSLSQEDCWALSQEAMQYYWRRISFFELKEYALAQADAEHNLGILDMCQDFAEHSEDRQIADQYRVFVTSHRIQARALEALEHEQHEQALQVINTGIAEIEDILVAQDELEAVEGDCPELKFLRDWEKEVEDNRPRSPQEKLLVDLQAAVEDEKFELAARLRDRLRDIEHE